MLHDTKEKSNARRRELYILNRDKCIAAAKRWQAANQEKVKKTARLNYLKNREKQIAYTKARKKANPEHYRELKRIWSKNNRPHIREYVKNKLKTDPNFRMASALRKRFQDIVRRDLKTRKAGSTREILGCSYPEFKDYIKSKFTAGMSWENYGFNGWHIDHIMPCASFDLTLPEQQRLCFHYTNMQPLWAKDNFRKADKIISINE